MHGGVIGILDDGSRSAGDEDVTPEFLMCEDVGAWSFRRNCVGVVLFFHGVVTSANAAGDNTVRKLRVLVPGPTLFHCERRHRCCFDHWVFVLRRA